MILRERLTYIVLLICFVSIISGCGTIEDNDYQTHSEKSSISMNEIDKQEKIASLAEGIHNSVKGTNDTISYEISNLNGDFIYWTNADNYVLKSGFMDKFPKEYLVDENVYGSVPLITMYDDTTDTYSAIYYADESKEEILGENWLYNSDGHPADKSMYDVHVMQRDCENTDLLWYSVTSIIKPKYNTEEAPVWNYPVISSFAQLDSGGFIIVSTYGNFNGVDDKPECDYLWGNDDEDIDLMGIVDICDIMQDKYHKLDTLNESICDKITQTKDNSKEYVTLK